MEIEISNPTRRKSGLVNSGISPIALDWPSCKRKLFWVSSSHRAHVNSPKSLQAAVKYKHFLTCIACWIKNRSCLSPQELTSNILPRDLQFPSPTTTIKSNFAWELSTAIPKFRTLVLPFWASLIITYFISISSQTVGDCYTLCVWSVDNRRYCVHSLLQMAWKVSRHSVIVVTNLNRAETITHPSLYKLA